MTATGHKGLQWGLLPKPPTSSRGFCCACHGLDHQADYERGRREQSSAEDTQQHRPRGSGRATPRWGEGGAGRWRQDQEKQRAAGKCSQCTGAQGGWGRRGSCWGGQAEESALRTGGNVSPGQEPNLEVGEEGSRLGESREMPRNFLSGRNVCYS